jgi:2'-5' RNA ligase
MISRGFLAVVPPEPALDAVEQFIAGLELPASARLTRRPQWHVTLQFLGRVGEVEAVREALDEAVALLPPVTVRFGGGGAFPVPERGTVAFLGLGEGSDALRVVASAVAGVLAPLGFAADDAPYHPHLTLARFRSPADLQPFVAAVGQQPVGPAWSACDVILYESTTLPSGAVYEERARAALCG